MYLFAYICITIKYNIMKTNKSIRLNQELLGKLEKIAKSENRTLSNLIEKILLEYVNK